MTKPIALGCFALALALFAGTASADEQGEIVQSDTLGMNVLSHNFDKSTNSDVTDAQNLSQFIGLHYYVIDHVRLGMNLQFTERLAPSPASGTSRLQTFALLPQIGWNFYKPFWAALTVTIAPWTGGKSTFDGGFQGVFGLTQKLSPSVSLSVGFEIPVNFIAATTIGITPLVGLGFKL